MNTIPHCGPGTSPKPNMNSITLHTFLSLFFLSLVIPPKVNAQQPGDIEVHDSVRNDTSPPLKAPGPTHAPASRREIDPPRLNPNRIAGALLFAPGLVDTAIQSKPGPAVPITIKASVYGLGLKDPDDKNRTLTMAIEGTPPDTNGMVGDTQYVQTVNTSFAVFDKKDLTKVLYGPAPINIIWKGFGGPCEANNDGDPIVQYDKIQNRWVISQFRVHGGGFSQCIAVSEKSDATGKYHRYEFSEPSFNDYPKMGVWPDGYYFTYNMFGNPEGARIGVYERDKMLEGKKAREIALQLKSNFFNLLPSDFDGAADANHIPPNGSPCFFLSLGTAADSLDLWKFKVNWANPTASTFGDTSHRPDKTIRVAHFVDASSLETVPQFGTSQKLDALGDRLLYRSAYRRFDDHHESLVVNHCVKGTAVAGIRWYEIRDPSGENPAVFQQGTFSPDNTCRWMGSVAMDKLGNIALGYSASSRDAHGSIRLAVQKANPPAENLGILSAEQIVKESKSSQEGASRWGDYSSMGVDPVDDSTFYFTTEYLAQTANGSFNWSTRIVVFAIE